MKFYTKCGDEIALSNYSGSKRIILLFVPSAIAQDAVGYLAQFEKSGKDLSVRDLKIFVVTDEESNLFERKFGADIEVVFQKQLSSIGSASVLRSEPLLILIGKDRTVKLRERHFVSKSALFAVIDSMPMRKSEMKHGQH